MNNQNVDIAVDGGYTCTEGGDDVTASEVIRAALREKVVLQKELAKKMELTPLRLNQKLRADNFTAKEFFDALDHLGLTITIIDKETGETVNHEDFKQGTLPRLKMIHEGVRYDTARADALCHSDEHDELIIELYRRPGDKYFLVLFPSWKGGKPSIQTCDEKYAKQFYKNHRRDTDPEWKK